MPYISKQEALEQIHLSLDNAKFCAHCLTELAEGDDDDGNFWYCPNALCLHDEQYYE